MLNSCHKNSEDKNDTDERSKCHVENSKLFCQIVVSIIPKMLLSMTLFLLIGMIRQKKEANKLLASSLKVKIYYCLIILTVLSSNSFLNLMK